jgi:hypothetical protein
MTHDKSEFEIPVEKKNALGLWCQKIAVVRGISVVIFDDGKKTNPIAQIHARTVRREGLTLTISGARSDEDLQVRAVDQRSCDFLHDRITSALIKFGKLKLRSKFQLLVDPRTGLPIIDVPHEHAKKNPSLKNAVVHWFSPVTKFGSPSILTKKYTTENRIGFCTDVAFYMMRQSSEITRCVRITTLRRVFTNAGTTKDDPFIVMKMSGGEHDVFFTSPEVPGLIQCLQAIFFYDTKGAKLPIAVVQTPQEADLNLTRPSNFQMMLIMPTKKDQLRRGLEEYAGKHGVSWGVTPRDTTPKAAERSVKKLEDPLAEFLQFCGCDSYYEKLACQNIDLDVLECMDEEDFVTFGVTDDMIISRIRNGFTNSEALASIRKKYENFSGSIEPQRLQSAELGHEFAIKGEQEIDSQNNGARSLSLPSQIPIGVDGVDDDDL